MKYLVLAFVCGSTALSSTQLCSDRGGKGIIYSWTQARGLRPIEGKLTSQQKLFIDDELVAVDKTKASGRLDVAQTSVNFIGEKTVLVSKGKRPDPVLTVFRSNAKINWMDRREKKELEVFLECTEYLSGLRNP